MKSKVLKTTAVFLAINLLAEIVFPTAVYALGGGPSQPEVQSFEPVGTTEMVDLSTGDFVYNIPLLDVDGYPINISYHSGVTMDQEASWVGLGWNINPGVINRNMRGIPDDFNGDEDAITKDFYLRPNMTYGMSFGENFELFGLGFGKGKKSKFSGSITASLGVFYNNYRGVGFERSIAPSISAGNGFKFNASLAISSNTQSGMTISPQMGMSFSHQMSKKDKQATHAGVNFSIGSSVNSRTGIKTLTQNKGISFTQGKGSDAKNPLAFNNGGSSVTYATETYTPQISMPMTGFNATFNVKWGPDLVGADPSWNIKGYFSGQWIPEYAKRIKKGAYGFLYAHNANRKDVINDLNREKDGNYSKSNPNLPITTFTNDVYSVNGQGIGGMYRPFRGDVGHVYDDEASSNGNGVSGGYEFNTGSATKWGADVVFNYTEAKSGGWGEEHGNALITKLDFKDNGDIGNSSYEPAYFKNVGEKTQADHDFLPYQKINEVLRPALFHFDDKSGKPFSGSLRSDKLMLGDANETNPADNGKILDLNSRGNYRTKRDIRNQSISYLTASQAGDCFGGGVIDDYNGANTYPFIPTLSIARTSINNSRKAHHITQITATNIGGSRYVYGIPAYNHTQEEITFTNAMNMGDCNTGLGSYAGKNYLNTRKGESGDAYDAFYNGTTTPAYAHSYLLTAVLSPDYVDVGNDGATPDDYGTYTKINYSRVATNYKWRTPYDLNKGLHNEGMKSDEYDDKLSIVYGEKELWYIHSIESRNYVAVFKTSPRLDAIGAAGKNGGMSNVAGNRSYKLDEIVLYSRVDLDVNGLANATPVKTVYFEYDYSLCPGIKNGDQAGVDEPGKLTLKKIYFTYGKSNKGKLSKYEFNYSNNKPYDIKDYDRWGNYKPNQSCNNLNNTEFPYAVQNKAMADEYASAWLLNEILLPSGGVIQVEYEADDYAYVQDKKAMQMFRVTGFSPTGASAGNELYDDKNARNWVHVSLTTPCENTSTFAKNYIPDQTSASDNTRFLFFTLLTHVKLMETDKEYVRGYAEIAYSENPDDYIKKIGSSGNEYAIKVKSVLSEDTERLSYADNASPFAKAAWQHFRLALPQRVYPGSNVKKNPQLGVTALKSLYGIFFDAFEYIQGVNDLMLKRKFAKYVDLSRCWVRLNNGIGFKRGGGVRVRSINLANNWSTQSELNDTYGQVYSYTTMENGVTISSGVASYEPAIGNDENPFRQPVFTNKKNVLIPDESFYAEEPFGESYFPGASITYSKVTVANKPHTNVNKNATGTVVNEFYTTRDFPTITKRTGTQIAKIKPNWLGALFRFRSFTQVSTVQGYQIELNDMNGKPKAEWIYEQNLTTPGEQGKLISGKQYFYRTDPTNPKLLNNNVRIIKSTGEVVTDDKVLLGVDAEMVFDTREQNSKNGTYGVALNNNNIYIGIGVIPAFVPLPSYNGEVTRFRSGVLTRVINRYGILEKTVAYTDGASLSTENIAFDPVTGEVLLTKTQNEYKDPIYNLTYPAHWAYPGMGPVYNNPAAKNMQSTPIMNLTSKVEPVLNNGTQKMVYGATLATNLPGIINAGAVTFSDIWRTYCQKELANICDLDFNAEEVVTLLNNICTENGGFPTLAGGQNATVDIPANDNSFIRKTHVLANIPKQVNISRQPNFNSLIRYMIQADNPYAPINLEYTYFLEIDENVLSTCNLTALKPVSITYISDNVSVVNPSNPDYRAHMITGFINISILFSGCIIPFDARILVDHQLKYGRCLSACKNTFPVSNLNTAWRKVQDYAYLNNRIQANNVREDGAYAAFNTFWIYRSNNWQANLTDVFWQSVSKTTNYSPEGLEIESKDALNRYSAMLFEDDRLPMAVANNSQQREMAFDGFEYYTFISQSGCSPRHWNFKLFAPSAEYTIDQTQAHTGTNSLKLINDQVAINTYTLKGCFSPEQPYSLGAPNDCEECIQSFSPLTNKQYVISGWVKVAGLGSSVNNYTAKVDVTCDGLTQPNPTITPKGPIIEGWQRFEAKFSTAANSTYIMVTLRQATGNKTTWYDDLRIYPADGNLKSFVYDKYTKRLTAELDENNYATFYEYDEQGALKRVKKETENGIMTLKESRNHNKR